MKPYLKSFLLIAFGLPLLAGCLMIAAALLNGDLLCVEINSVVYTFGFCLKTRLSSYSALSRMSIDTGKPLCS
ncbi:hypothetical protein [Eikenella corrodens]|uniref:hypothetical protein n=1 Tax=Eikenella corrodens TaxID=539 RepID=UPI00129BA50F|nr:hypothetical protein [Eikenella corrodens]